MVSYDLRSIWDSADSWIGLGMQAHTNTTEIDFEMQFLWLNDIDPEVLIGRPSMGGLFTLADHSCTDLVWPFSAGGHTATARTMEGPFPTLKSSVPSIPVLKSNS